MLVWDADPIAFSIGPVVIRYYGLFFADKILIFKMSSSEVLKCPGYSNKQHRNNIGEGQFHINNDNLSILEMK